MIVFKPIPGASKLLALGLLLTMTGAAEAAPKPKVSKLAYDSVANVLTVKGAAKAGTVNLYDAVADQWLAEQAPVNGKFSFTLNNLPTKPCSIRVEAGGASVITKLKKVPGCFKGDLPPVCKIVNPSKDQQISFGGKINFSGRASDPEKTALNYEWDFGGGASARSTEVNAGEVIFDVRNDTLYTVSFTATDLNGRRCTDKIKVAVGTPPEAPAKVSEQTAKEGDPGYAVLPFQPYGMAFHDMGYSLYSMVRPTNWINAQILKKGSVGGAKPVLLSPDEAGVKYSAASNPQDPAGKGSINSTSQNYPIGKTYGEASIKKSDWFDPCMVWKNTAANTDGVYDLREKTFFEVYQKQNPYAMRNQNARFGGVSGNQTNAECQLDSFFLQNWGGNLKPLDSADPTTFAYVLLEPDTGAAYWPHELIKDVDRNNPSSADFKGLQGVLQPNGSSMPGRDKPYQENEPQAFATTEMKETGDNYPGFDSSRNMFAALGLPMFPTDDQGRHNAYPVMRVQAHDKSGKLLATTDAVTAVTTEFKCAECHTKGKNGADQAVYDGLKIDMDANKAGLEKYKGLEKWIPKFVAPEDVNAARKNDRDVIEQASMINIARLHDFYYNFIEESGWLGPLEFQDEPAYGKAGDVHVEPGNCSDYCHKSVPRDDPRRYNMSPGNDAGSACPEMSDSLHNIHGRLLGTMNADFTGTIERDPLNRELKLADLSKPDKTKPFLLTVKDAGTPDDSCFFCHAGKQDKYQRDVMTAAGVNCIDCHGDLAVLAGGGAMTSRDKSFNPIDSRGGPGDLTVAIDKDKLAKAYSSERSSYRPKADGTYYYLEKGADGLYRREGKVVTTLDMALNFLKKTTGVVNADGTFTLTEKVKDKPDVVTTVTEAQLLDLDKVKEGVNTWLLSFTRIPWAEQLSCASCHTGLGDEPVRRRAYDMTTGQFKWLSADDELKIHPNNKNPERFSENLQPKKHDSSFTLEVQNGQNCPPGTFSDTVTDGGKHVCKRGLFKDSIDRHGLVSCQACHGGTHAVWPNPDPYANDNVTAMQLQGHTGTILECTACHTADAFKMEDSIGSRLHYPDNAGNPTILAGPHNMHPVNDQYWVNKDGGFHNKWAKKAGANGEDQCATCHGKDHLGTRLSKTPVDRMFTTGKEKKFKKVMVKAGTPIGCDLCHNVEKSKVIK